MEGVKCDVRDTSGNSPSHGSEKEVNEARFADLCKKDLKLNDNTCAQALKLLQETKHILSVIGNGMPGEPERFWFAFVLYSVKKLSEKSDCNEQRGSEDSGFNLWRILRVSQLSLVDFFKEFPQFVVRAGGILSNMFGTDWETRLEAKELQANFVYLQNLSRYYKSAYTEFFASVEEDDKKATVGILSDNMSDYYRFGWLLFLALRIHVFSRFKDLVTSTNGLVSILAILILHIPVRFRSFNIQGFPRFVKKGDKGIDLLASLCNIFETSEDELMKTMEMVNNLIIDILKKTPRKASECQVENLKYIDTDGLIYFEDLMAESSFSSSIQILESDYNDAIRSNGELDERVFINEKDDILGLGTLSGGSGSGSGSGSTGSRKRNLDSRSSPSKTITSPLSPHRSPVSHGNGAVSASIKFAATPVSTAMTTAKWLRTIISPLPSKPSAEMTVFLVSCDKDVTVDILHRAEIILEAIFPSSALGERCVTGTLQCANLMDNVWAEQRRLESLKLYYRVLEAMCKAEAQILHMTNLTSLLTNERFHRCMLACSAELVLATHKTVTMLFPAVLDRTGITSFDLSKVIESFIRHEESLPRELRRHLNSLEERLLESMVWGKGSSMFNSLIVAKPTLSAEINYLGLLAEPMPSLDAVRHANFCSGGSPVVPSLQKQEISTGQNGDIRSPKRLCTEYRSLLVERNSFTSPVKDRLPPLPLQSAFASPTRPSPTGGVETCAETGIKIFFGKINRLAAVRINGMVERLQFSPQIRESIYRLFQQILDRRTYLFFNRHIDQIILCCFYGVAKINQLKPTFKEIVYNYRKQPQCKPQVFRSVFVDWSSSTRHDGRTGQGHVDIITFYNEIFIPSVKALLVEIGPVGAASKADRAPEINNNINGKHCASPKLSSFPSLPDMSPQKVSAARNVYVSPLRTSKMDSLISHSSKSLYACVGESTHAYQSPSKDLTAINNQLNGNRKARGMLNFDNDGDVGLVSDSLVASSLSLQNGSCDSSSGAPMKIEQLEL